VVGFYLINIGFVSLALKYGEAASNAQQGIETLSTKIGLVLVVLGCMHFFNLFVFSKMRQKALRQRPVDVVPVDSWTTPDPRNPLSRIEGAKLRQEE